MKKELKVGPLIYPMPVLMISTYNEDGSIDVMNAAWGAPVDNPDLMGISLYLEHQTVKNFQRTKGFVVAMATAKTIKWADYFGMVSASIVKDKFAKSGLHAHKAETVDAPIIDEFPVALECELAGINEEGIVYGRIKKVWADEEVITPEGKIDITKVDGVLFDTNTESYYKIGDFLAKAFGDCKE